MTGPLAATGAEVWAIIVLLAGSYIFQFFSH